MQYLHWNTPNDSHVAAMPCMGLSLGIRKIGHEVYKARPIGEPRRAKEQS
jgi:hypothetical protein